MSKDVMPRRLRLAGLIIRHLWQRYVSVRSGDRRWRYVSDGESPPKGEQVEIAVLIGDGISTYVSHGVLWPPHWSANGEQLHIASTVYAWRPSDLAPPLQRP